MKKLQTALDEAGMSLEEYDALVAEYAKYGLYLLWSRFKKRWTIEIIGCGEFTWAALHAWDINEFKDTAAILGELAQKCPEVAERLQRNRKENQRCHTQQQRTTMMNRGREWAQSSLQSQ